ncbi:MAG TPA: DHHA1 domain-containing protein [Bryobacteraceae bacterium]|nr:DHHA1 domain-containing protein [Bryobacteraceae bacterium]
MTERLYYRDSYLTEFRACVVDASPDRLRVYLDRTAFYPTSGGQPFDTGSISGIEVIEVIDEGERIAHVLRAPFTASEVDARIDAARRFDHMQQHTGQHLLSAVLLELFDDPTVSFHLGAESSTIDVSRPLEPAQIREAERRANQVVFENRPVTVGFQHSSEDLDLRKPTEREGEVRIITIQDLDRSACGGTHVRATGEIGPILLRKLDRIRGNLRIEFLCGGRALARARADYEALSQIARVFSSPLDEAPAMVEAQREKLQEADKTRRRLATELAESNGRALYAATAAGPDGIRRVFRRVETLGEDLRPEVQSFIASGPTIFLILAANPPAVLLGCSKDSGVNAGDVVKRSLAESGGRGGGNATLAQGSLPSKEALEGASEGLVRQLGLER